MCKLKGLTEYQIADNASVSRLQRPRPENVLFQKQRAKKVPLFPTDVTVPKLHIDLVSRPKKYRRAADDVLRTPPASPRGCPVTPHIKWLGVALKSGLLGKLKLLTLPSKPIGPTG